MVAEIRAGRVDAAPANPDKCRNCEFRDVCRVEAGGAAGYPLGRAEGA
jgi:CRISPR/Cas system-associated exonuclease Cas4 (RecB family)